MKKVQQGGPVVDLPTLIRQRIAGGGHARPHTGRWGLSIEPDG